MLLDLPRRVLVDSSSTRDGRRGVDVLLLGRLANRARALAGVDNGRGRGALRNRRRASLVVPVVTALAVVLVEVICELRLSRAVSGGTSKRGKVEDGAPRPSQRRRCRRSQSPRSSEGGVLECNA